MKVLAIFSEQPFPVFSYVNYTNKRRGLRSGAPVDQETGSIKDAKMVPCL